MSEKLSEYDILDEPFIYIYEKALNTMICKEIITMFEMDETKGHGLTGTGFSPHVKNAINLDIDDAPKWSKIYDLLINELCRNIKRYIKQMENYSNGLIRQTLALNFVQFDNPMIQKYIKNEGKYAYHDDFQADYDKKRYRIFTYIFYLNDVIEGGETEFLFGKYKIKPTTGKLMLFPASWTFPHCGKMPYSDDKYIITGWIYYNDNEYINEYVKEYKNNPKNK